MFVLTLLIWGYPVLYFFSAFKTYKKLKEKNNLTALMYASLPILAFAAFALCMAAIGSLQQSNGMFNWPIESLWGKRNIRVSH